MSYLDITHKARLQVSGLTHSSSMSETQGLSKAHFLHMGKIDDSQRWNEIKNVNVSLTLIHIYHIFFTHSSTDGHLGCFYVLVIINSATMNTEVLY